jgi:hypothetical protein
MIPSPGSDIAAREGLSVAARGQLTCSQFRVTLSCCVVRFPAFVVSTLVIELFLLQYKKGVQRMAKWLWNGLIKSELCTECGANAESAQIHYHADRSHLCRRADRRPAPCILCMRSDLAFSES